MTVYQWLCLLGVPALIAAIAKYLGGRIRKNQTDTEALKNGIQALLRSQMIADYNKWSERGYAPIYARESFQNCWRQYHSLGANGVMDDLHEKFLELPTEKGRVIRPNGEFQPCQTEVRRIRDDGGNS